MQIHNWKESTCWNVFELYDYAIRLLFGKKYFKIDKFGHTDFGKLSMQKY